MHREAAKLRAVAVVVLAVGIAAALIIVTVSILYDAKRSHAAAGLSNNATQVLLSVFSGIIGVLGAYVGFKAGNKNNNSTGRQSWPGETEAETKELRP
jgi:hypothetical protein